MKQGIGILGGSFDPIHNGHIAMARAALEERDLHQVIFVPAAQNPLKTKSPQAGDEHRLAMLRLALAPFSEFSIDTREIEAREPSYTIHTVSALREEFMPHTQLFWIMGSDNLKRFHEWKDVAQLVDMLDGFVIFRRNGEDAQVHQLSDELHKLLEDEARQKIISGYSRQVIQAISASDIRAKIAEGKSLDGLVPEEVQRYVFEKNLYTLGSRRKSIGSPSNSGNSG